MISEIDDPDEEIAQLTYQVMVLDARLKAIETTLFQSFSDELAAKTRERNQLATSLILLKNVRPALYESILKILSPQERDLLGLE